MRAAFLIAAKDLRERFRDRSAIMIAFVVPLALAAIFGLIFSGTEGEDLFHYAVVDQDGGDIATIFTDQVLQDVQKQGVIEITTADSLEEGKRMVADGEVSATFVVPAGFSDAVRSGKAAELQVIGNVDAQTGTEVARSIATSFGASLNAVRLSVATALPNAAQNPAAAQELAVEAADQPDALVVKDVSATRRELSAKTHFAAGMAVFFLFFTVQFGVSSLLEERNDGTLARLLAAPIQRASILGGKLLTSFLLGVISMSVLVIATSLLLGASWGNPLGVAILIVCGVLAAMGIMALVATMAKSAEQAGNWQAIIALVLGMLGGVFFPIALAGGLIAQISLIAPQAWFMRGLGDLQSGASWSVVLPAAAAMLLFAAVTGGIALTRLGRLMRI